MYRSGACFFMLLSLVALTVEAGGVGRALKQANKDPNAGVTITVSQQNPNVNAISITPVLPYPQTGYFCNISGDSRFPAAGGEFPLTVRVPVGVTSKVIFANITGTIPGTGSGCVTSVIQQPGTSINVGSTSVVQPGTSSVVQPGTSSVVQPGTSSVVQPGTTSVVQPGTSSVVQPGTSSVVQPGTSSVVQPGTSSVVQPGTSSVVQPGTSSVVQPGTSSVVQPGTSSVVQPGTAASPPLCSTTPTTVVQQPTTVVQQPGTPGVQVMVGRRLLDAALKPAAVEFISNNGSMGQPQLVVLDTVEGVPNIMFKPTAVGQTASFTGALQVAVTTTHDGFGLPYVPYQVDPKLSPNCGMVVKFVAI